MRFEAITGNGWTYGIDLNVKQPFYFYRGANACNVSEREKKDFFEINWDPLNLDEAD